MFSGTYILKKNNCKYIIIELKNYKLICDQILDLICLLLAAFNNIINFT